MPRLPKFLLQSMERFVLSNPQQAAHQLASAEQRKLSQDRTIRTLRAALRGTSPPVQTAASRRASLKKARLQKQVASETGGPVGAETDARLDGVASFLEREEQRALGPVTQAETASKLQRVLLGTTPAGGAARGLGGAFLLNSLLNRGDGGGGAETNPLLAQLAAEQARDDALAQSLIGSRQASASLRGQQAQTEGIEQLLKLAQLQSLVGSPGASFSV